LASQEEALIPGLILDGPETAPITLALAHGAGAPMDSDFMAAFAEGLGARGLRVARFEFPYMAARRRDGRKRPPDREAVLLDAWRRVIDALRPGPLAIGGKSLGGRMASLIADASPAVGLVCLGYPFHPPGKPERLRTAHLETLKTPTLICQGTRDALGNALQVSGYRLSPAIRLHWAEDGDHGLVPRKGSGRTAEQNWAEAMDAIAAFLSDVGGAPR
jgi:predicted alpha/beta-hydrolase family hydrolase